MNEDYTTIAQPYDAFLDRDPPGLQGNNGNVETQPVKTGGAMGDMTMDSVMQSTNWSPETSGFYIDGQSGYAEFSNVFISGSITATSGNIGGFDIGSNFIEDAADTMGLSSDSTESENVRFWAGSTFANRDTAPFRVTDLGNLTSVGASNLSIKTYTCFENTARFISFGQSGSGAFSFGNTGMDLTSGASSGSAQNVHWIVTNDIFDGKPVFSTVLTMTALNSASGAAGAFVGLGNAGVDGTGFTFTGFTFCGFYIQKAAGVVSLYAVQNDGDGSFYTSSNQLTTLTDGTYIDLILKVNGSTSVDYYWRKSSVGSLSTVTTLTTHIPTGAVQPVFFAISNQSSAVTFDIGVLSASYER